MVSLREVAELALFMAEGCARILPPIFEFIGGTASHQRSPAVDAAVTVLILPIPMVYLAGVILAYLHVTPAPAASAPAAPKWFMAITFTLVAVALVAVALAAGSQ